MIRTVVTVFPFNGMPKNYRFTYDTEADTGIEKFILGGFLKDVTAESEPETVVLQMPSIESDEEIGDIGGPSADQPSHGRKGRQRAVQASGAEDVQGDQGDGAGMA
jgi:hypothetical protein